MATQPDAPADTSMMRIVHSALRRDLDRARTELATDPPPPPARRQAIGRHLTWMMAFLHAHHRSEDEGLYPFVRARHPEGEAIFDVLAEQHAEIAASITAIETEAAALTSDNSSGELVCRRAIRALDDLAQVLLPHLRQEEDDAMPIVSSTITNAEWQAIEQQHNLDGKSSAELGYEGHWLIDDASPEDRAIVVGLVPPVPRFILLHAFARSYRRRKVACWGEPARPPRRVQRSGGATVVTRADRDAVWQVVRDITRVGEWSHECVGTEWMKGSSSVVPGARFRGRNRQGLFRWGRVCEIVSAEPYELVYRTVPTAFYPDSTQWSIRLDTSPEGTVIRQTFEVVKGSKLLAAFYGLIIPAHRDRTVGLTRDLERMVALATPAVVTAAPTR